MLRAGGRTMHGITCVCNLQGFWEGRKGKKKEKSGVAGKFHVKSSEPLRNCGNPVFDFCNSVRTRLHT